MEEGNTSNVEDKMDVAEEGKTKAEILEKARRFWTHPSLQHVSAEEKMHYLSSRGLSQEDIHTMWEQLVEEPDAKETGASVSPDMNSGAPPSPPSDNTNDQQRPVSPSFPYPQQQPPYYSPQQPYYPQNQQYASNDATSSFMDVSALVAIGGALGLTAAAAVRWLNGGDFVLLPPPTRNTFHVDNDYDGTIEENALGQEHGTSDVLVDNEHEPSSVENDMLEHHHSDEHNVDFPQVMELLETKFAQQHGLLQQISSRTNNQQVTNDCMNLLRKDDGSSSNKKLQEDLIEIKEQLKRLSTATTSEASNGTVWKGQLEECLTQLQDCIQQLSSTTISVDEKRSTDASGAPPIVHETNASALFPQDASLPCTTTPTTITTEGASKSILLRHAIQRLAHHNEPENLRAGAQLLYLYVMNLSSHVHVPRYQTIFTNNTSFQKVQELNGGIELLLAVGFEQEGNFLQWQGGPEDVVYLKEAAAALSILKSCRNDIDAAQLSSHALSVLRPSTPPIAAASLTLSDLQTPVFIASPPTTKKHPMLDESNNGGEDSILDISNASEQFRLESLLAQPVISSNDVPMFEHAQHVDIPKTNLSMRGSDEVEDEEEEQEFESASEEWIADSQESKSTMGNVDESGDTAELSKEGSGN